MKICNYFKIITEENVSQKIRLKNINKKRNYFLEEIKQSELMSRKHKKVFTTLNYIEHFVNLASTITWCVSISAFVSLIGIAIGLTGSKIGFEICAITAGIQKKKKNYDKTAVLVKSKLNSIDVLISKALIDSGISHDECVLINNVLKEYNEIKEKI